MDNVLMGLVNTRRLHPFLCLDCQASNDLYVEKLNRRPLLEINTTEGPQINV